jgi:hypothetical protein
VIKPQDKSTNLQKKQGSEDMRIGTTGMNEATSRLRNNRIKDSIVSINKNSQGKKRDGGRNL